MKEERHVFSAGITARFLHQFGTQDGFRKQKHKFSRSIYKEQHNLNMEIYSKLEQATITEDVEEINTLLNEDMELIVSGTRC